jgi:peptide/nickel transport system permease protein
LGLIGSLDELASTFGFSEDIILISEPSTLEAPVFLSPLQDPNYLLGTDRLGRDLFGMIVHATPAMIKMILAGALLSVVVGTLVGTLAGYIGGRLDTVLMTVTDTVLTIPALPLIIVLAAIYAPEDPIIVGLLLGIDNWPRLSRNLRSQVLSIREEAFTEASRIMGLSKATILRRDVITNMMPYILISFSNGSRKIIFESVALYYLGILPFTSLNWGVMMNEAYKSGNMTDPGRVHWILIPMMAIIFTSLGFILLSQGMDRVFNVRLRAEYSKTQEAEE